MSREGNRFPNKLHWFDNDELNGIVFIMGNIKASLAVLQFMFFKVFIKTSPSAVEGM